MTSRAQLDAPAWMVRERLRALQGKAATITYVARVFGPDKIPVLGNGGSPELVGSPAVAIGVVLQVHATVVRILVKDRQVAILLDSIRQVSGD